MDANRGIVAVAGLGSILGVWAHPDDETYLSGGLVATARRAGSRVVVATATRGEDGGEPARREAELGAALAALGVAEHRWLGFADGACDAVAPSAGAAALERLLAEVRPDTILTFGADGVTGHPDHVALHRWVRAAWDASGRAARLLEATLTPRFHAEWGARCDEVGIWMAGSPPCTPERECAVVHEARGCILDAKLAALRAHASQTAGLEQAVGAPVYRRWWATEAFVEVPPGAVGAVGTVGADGGADGLSRPSRRTTAAGVR
jgi:LmbE family N-acetylglucosaminyl deacetylase